MFTISKIVTLCCVEEESKELAPVSNFEHRSKSRKENKDVQVTMPVYPQTLMLFEHFKSPLHPSPSRLSFVLVGAQPYHEFLKKHSQYRDVIHVDFSQRIENIESIFDVVSHLPNCREVVVRFDQMNIGFGPADDGLPENDGNSIQLFKKCISKTVCCLRIIGSHDLAIEAPSRFDACLVLAEGYFPNLEYLIIDIAGTENERDAAQHLLYKLNLGDYHTVELDDTGVVRCGFDSERKKTSFKTHAKNQASLSESRGRCSSAVAVDKQNKSNDTMQVSLKRLDGTSNLSRPASRSSKSTVVDSKPKKSKLLATVESREKPEDLSQINNQAQRKQVQFDGLGERQEREEGMVPWRRERPPNPYPRSIPQISDDEYEITKKRGDHDNRKTHESNSENPVAYQQRSNALVAIRSTYENWESSSDEDWYLRGLQLKEIPHDVVQNVKLAELKKILDTVNANKEKQKAGGAATIKQESPEGALVSYKRKRSERKPKIVFIEGIHYERRPKKVPRAF